MVAVQCFASWLSVAKSSLDGYNNNRVIGYRSGTMVSYQFCICKLTTNLQSIVLESDYSMKIAVCFVVCFCTSVVTFCPDQIGW